MNRDELRMTRAKVHMLAETLEITLPTVIQSRNPAHVYEHLGTALTALAWAVVGLTDAALRLDASECPDQEVPC